MDKKTKKVTEKASPDNSEGDNVDKIRDILFGNQMREFDRKFALLEKNISTDLDSIRKENSNQIESLQSFIESEIGILTSKLTNTEKTQFEEMDKLESNLQKHVKQIDARILKTNESINDLSRDINQKILKQSQDTATDIRERMQESRERMDGHRQELAAGKVDKSSLSEMLSNLALQINADNSDQN